MEHGVLASNSLVSDGRRLISIYIYIIIIYIYIYNIIYMYIYIFFLHCMVYNNSVEVGATHLTTHSLLVCIKW